MNIQKMMQQAQQMQQKIGELQTKLEAEETEGSAGSGAVRVRINGKHAMLKVSIADSLMQPSEKEMLEDLLVAAYNDARGKVDATLAAEMNKMTGSLGLPPGFKLPF